MKKYFIFIMAVTAVMTASAVLFTQLHYKNAGPDKTDTVRLNTFKTELPGQQDFSVRLRWFGTVESKKRVEIKPVTDGKIVQIRVQDGAQVKLNEPLFVLGGKVTLHEQEILRKQVSSFENQVSFMKNVVRSRNYSVSKKLTAKENLFAAEARLAALKGKLATARQKLASLNDSLLIRSPMDGIFTDRIVSQGQYVTKGAPLADVISKDLRITARVFAPTDTRLHDKMVVARSASGKGASGTVSAVMPMQTPDGATVIWIEGNEISNTMKPGESVSGWILIKKYTALAVPRKAVLRDNQGQTFVVVDTGQGYRSEMIKIGLIQNGWCEIVSGVASTDKVVTRGAYEIFNRDFASNYKLID